LGQTLTEANGAAITVHGITSRGEEAMGLVMEWNPSSDEPPGGAPNPGNEFVIISLTVGYVGGEEETLYVWGVDFTAVVPGLVIVAAPRFGLGGETLEGEISPGGSIDRVLVLDVPEASTGMVLTYTVLGEQSYYFATE
jgi:hypothetical protein